MVQRESLVSLHNSVCQGFLYRLQLGHLFEECSPRFGVSSRQFSRNFTTWINLLSDEIELLCINAAPDGDIGFVASSHFQPQCYSDCSVTHHPMQSIISRNTGNTNITQLSNFYPSGAVTDLSKAYPGKSSDTSLFEANSEKKTCQYILL